MSSRGGPRAAGTDGSDFTHRERVASHYRESVRHKLKVKVCLWIHLFFVTCVVSWYGLAVLRLVKAAPQPWMLVWCISAFAALAGLTAIPKNKGTMMYVFAFGNLVTGIGPLMYGASFILTEVLNNYSHGIIPATQDWRHEASVSKSTWLFKFQLTLSLHIQEMKKTLLDRV
ncbi:protein jagunal homolog 1-like isoform X2 [Actinia tenebrosa]|uniref:Protein jagunal homolog 1-like isoform X2 n=1 Tax=Actinia tenebrosa TaxID=6105 RepID=A0A6P8J4B4_ACTTE|nr:protein jagunal homolog 1-like isoform X2 [Actinia tenebrosa]